MGGLLSWTWNNNRNSRAYKSSNCETTEYTSNPKGKCRAKYKCKRTCKTVNKLDCKTLEILNCRTTMKKKCSIVQETECPSINKRYKRTIGSFIRAKINFLKALFRRPSRKIVSREYSSNPRRISSRKGTSFSKMFRQPTYTKQSYTVMDRCLHFDCYLCYQNGNFQRIEMLTIL